MIYLVDLEGNFYAPKTEQEIKLADFITRVQTLKGEQSFDVEAGIDFLSVIEGRTLLKLEIEKIARDFTNYFDINIKDAETDKENRILKINIEVKTKDNTSFNTTVFIGR